MYKARIQIFEVPDSETDISKGKKVLDVKPKSCVADIPSICRIMASTLLSLSYKQNTKRLLRSALDAFKKGQIVMKEREFEVPSPDGSKMLILKSGKLGGSIEP